MAVSVGLCGISVDDQKAWNPLARYYSAIDDIAISVCNSYMRSMDPNGTEPFSLLGVKTIWICRKERLVMTGMELVDV